jgi:hypothetical protein
MLSSGTGNIAVNEADKVKIKTGKQKAPVVIPVFLLRPKVQGIPGNSRCCSQRI